MNITKVCAMYFSPTGNSKKAVCTIATQIAKALGVQLEEKSFTLPKERELNNVFSQETLLVIGSPTYAGKLPNKILSDFQSKIKGNNGFAVPIVTFGNRSFDNSLAELTAVLKQNGFHPVGGAAVVGEHAFSHQLATARPDATDVKELEHFAENIAEKIKLQEEPDEGKVPVDAQAPYYIPKGVDGTPVKFLKAKPLTREADCNGCGICAEKCPMGAISIENPMVVEGICIKCQSCIHTCPSNAKYFDDAAFLSHVTMLEQNYKKRKENVFIV